MEQGGLTVKDLVPSIGQLNRVYEVCSLQSRTGTHHGPRHPVRTPQRPRGAPAAGPGRDADRIAVPRWPVDLDGVRAAGQGHRRRRRLG
ncbi:hypothetical protein G6F24_017429 [Rhizopus arrhizus]|nr:hypothetical protein G6F24_017429 [Rhizopus arrhizus]